jgi:hypothetical protein
MPRTGMTTANLHAEATSHSEAQPPDVAAQCQRNNSAKPEESRLDPTKSYRRFGAPVHRLQKWGDFDTLWVLRL